MTLAMTELNKKEGFDCYSIECVCHTIQLAVRAWLTVKEIEDLLTACRKLVGHFKHLSHANDHLKKRQAAENEEFLVLTQECKTRWNST